MGYTSGQRQVVQVDGYTQEESDVRYLEHRRNLLINGNLLLWPGSGNTGCGKWRLHSDGFGTTWGINTATRGGGKLTTSNTTGSYLGIQYRGVEGFDIMQHSYSPLTLTTTVESNNQVDMCVKFTAKTQSGLTKTYMVDKTIPAGTSTFSITIPALGEDYIANVGQAIMFHYTLAETRSEQLSGISEQWYEGSENAISSMAGPPSGTEIIIHRAQLEAGTEPTPFEYRHVGDEAQMLARYMQNVEVEKFVAVIYTSNGDTRMNAINFPVPMRDIPTVSPTSFSAHSINFSHAGEQTNTPTGTWNVAPKSSVAFDFDFQGTFGGSSGAINAVGSHCDVTFLFDADF